MLPRGHLVRFCNVNGRRLFSYATKFCHRRMSSKSSEGCGQRNLAAITQMCCTSDKEGNMKQVETLIKRAKEQNASFVFLPECCDFVGEYREQTLEMSEPLTGQTMKQYQSLAREYKVWLSLGGIHESILDENQCKTDKVYNSHVILNDCGELVAVYRKLHLYDVETPEFVFQESKVVQPGNQLIPPIDTPIGRIGLQICYDIRFAECSLLLRKGGAQVLTYPAAFAYNTGKSHWDSLLRARAIENQCFVLAPAHVGWHNKKRRSWGHAMAVGPWGNVLADLETNPLDVTTVELDLSTIQPIRDNIPCFKHRRDDIYSLSVQHASTNIEEDFRFGECTIKKETVFLQTRYCYAFTNIRCVVEGHVLVATRRLVSRIQDLTLSEQTDIFTLVCLVQRMLELMYKTKSATVTVQDGQDAGQTVPHVHFHVMPRRPGDFKENDQVYVQLENQTENRCEERKLEERISEAQKYRDFLKSHQI